MSAFLNSPAVDVRPATASKSIQSPASSQPSSTSAGHAVMMGGGAGGVANGGREIGLYEAWAQKRQSQITVERGQRSIGGYQARA